MAASAITSSSTSFDFPEPFWPEGLDRRFLLPVLLANGVSYILLGSLVVQILYYSRKYKKDPLLMRATIWILLAANLVLGGSQLARDIVILGLGFGDWRKLGDFHSRDQDFIVPVFSVLIISTSQSIIATRSYLFCRSLAGGHTSKLVVIWCSWKSALILSSLAFGIGAIVAEFQYANLFAVGSVNSVRDIGKSLFPLCEMMWLMLGTVADLSIAWSMYSDSKAARTGFKTSSDSFLSVLIGVSLRCGFVLALTQTLLNILYFADSPTWADAAHSVLPRISSLTVIYSITSPREAYRAFLRQEERRVDNALGSFDRRTETSATGRGGTNPSGSGTRGESSGSSRVRSVKKAVGGVMRKGGGLRRSFFGAGGAKKPRTSRVVGDEEEGWSEVDRGGNEERLGELLDGEDGMVMERRVVGTREGLGGGPNVATTTVISVERVEKEGEERLGNSVTIESLHPQPHSHHNQNQNHHLLRLSSSSLRRDRPKQSSRSNHTTSDPHPLRSPPSHPLPNFLDSFPSRPTVTSSVGTYDEAMVDEMFDLTERT